MKRTFHLALAFGLALAWVGLLALTLAMPAGATVDPAARGPAAIIRVPGDYDTIQEAIVAAQEGAEIRIQGGPDPKEPVTYAERLTITKGITLSGGWSEDFSEQSMGGHPTIVDAEGLGRAISVTTPTSPTIVTIAKLIITGGDATGLGGWQATAALPGRPPAYDDPGVPPTDTLKLAAILPASTPPEVGARQAELTKRLARWGNLGGSSPAAPTSRQAAAPAQTVDCGGGIFSALASLHLDSVYVADNQASRTGAGYGGGVCIVTAPLGGVMLVNTTIDQNIGADQGDSFGGGLFIADAPGVVLMGNIITRNRATTGGSGTGGGAYVASDGATLAKNAFSDNVASIAGDGIGGGVMLRAVAGTVMSNSIRYNVASGGALGLGGGLMITGSHTAQVTGNFMSDNLASGAGRGIGGGLHIAESDNVRVERNTFVENTAGSGPTAASTGGGAYAREAAAIVFAGNIFERNLGSLYEGGLGGGLYLYHLPGAQVQGNRFSKNWGAMYARNGAGGGGLGLGDVSALAVTGNTFDGNVAVLYTGGSASGHGGGIYAVVAQDSLIATNTFSANVGSWAGAGKGGGLATSPDTRDHNTERLVVADNTWLGNIASTGASSGAGGAIELRAVDTQVVRNRFEDNHGCAESSCSKGGTIYVHGWLLCRDITLDRNVMLSNLDPARVSQDDSLLAIDYVDAYTITNNLLVDAAVGAGVVVLSVGTNRDPDISSQNWVVNNTIVGGRTAAGIAVMAGLEKDSLSMINNIVVSHTVGITVAGESSAQTRLSYNLFDGNTLNVGGEGAYTQTHPVSGAPAFRNAPGQDYHLTVASAARDAGDPAGVPPASDHDADGVQRPFGQAVDIGAYEWHGAQLFLPLVKKQSVPRVGWAIGDAATAAPAIVGTTDGGKTWRLQKTSPAWVGLDGGDISAVDEQTAWAAMVSEPGATRDAIMHTTDGGAIWTVQALPAGVMGGVKSIKGLSPTEAWATAMSGVVLHTTNGGASWVIVPHPSAPITQVNRMDAIGPNIWIADSDAQGSVVYSHDAGRNWQMGHLVNNGQPDSPLTVHAVSPAVVWASGTESLTFYRSLNGGKDWAKAANVGGFDHLDDICASSAEDVWGVTNGGGVDGRIKRVVAPVGGTAQAFDVTPAALRGYMPGGVTCLDSRTAWVVGQQGPNPDPAKPNGVILTTTDGEHWTQAVAPADIHFWKISMAGARR